MISYCRHTHTHPDPKDKTLALEIKDLTVFYPGEESPAISQVQVSVAAGASLALVGPNGAGKSTLFKAISGLLPLRSGQIKIFGHRLQECHQRVVYLPQRSDIDWHFPVQVLDFVLFGRYVHMGWFARPQARDVQMAMARLDEVGGADLQSKHISKLSGGQQQRVLIARALVQDADLLLLDEPLNAVDSRTRDVVARVLDRMKANGRTVLVATHYYDQEEGRYDGAIYLRDGEQCC